MIDNVLQILTLLTLCACLYRLAPKVEKRLIKNFVEIDKLSKENIKGFGVVSDNEVILNDEQNPLVFDTYEAANSFVKENNKWKIKNRFKVVWQDWDMESRTVFVGEILNGSNQR